MFPLLRRTFTNALPRIQHTHHLRPRGKKGGKLANVEDNDDTVPYLCAFPVARSEERVQSLSFASVCTWVFHSGRVLSRLSSLVAVD